MADTGLTVAADDRSSGNQVIPIVPQFEIVADGRHRTSDGVACTPKKRRPYEKKMEEQRG